MLTEVSPAGRSRLAPLFEATPGWHGVISSILFGEMGQAFVDDPESPALSLLRLGFDNFVGGRATEPAIKAAIHQLPMNCFIVVPPDWNDPLEANYTRFITPQHRVAFQPPERWDIDVLRGFGTALPEGFESVEVTPATIETFAQYDRSFKNFASREDFLARGIGFGIRHEGRFVSACYSYAVGGGKLEIEIGTRPEFQRRGLATACAASLILRCLERSIEPCWDAANIASAGLATKLGFVEEQRYTAYYVHPVPVDDETAPS